MIIEMNVNLNITGHRNSLADCRERAIQAIAYLQNQFSRANVQTRRAQAQYEGPEGLVLEDTLVVRVELDVLSVAYRRIPSIVYRLAQNLDQDCIAVFNTMTGTGRLFGPNASKWGSFDLDYFTPFGDVAADEKAAA